MIIGVISDTHGSLAAWRRAYEFFFKDTDLIIHCGDVLYHGPRNPLPDGYNPSALAEELNNLTIPMVFVRGNCDSEVDQMVLDYQLTTGYTHLFTTDFHILAHHGHLPEPSAKVLSKFHLVISGHTHVPGLTKKEGIIHLNPGSPALPKNKEQNPTAALIEGKKISIYNLRTREEVATLSAR